MPLPGTVLLGKWRQQAACPVGPRAWPCGLGVEGVPASDGVDPAPHGLGEPLGEGDHAHALLAGHVGHVEVPAPVALEVGERRAHGVRADATHISLRQVTTCSSK